MQPNDGQPQPEPKSAPTPVMDVVPPRTEPAVPLAGPATSANGGVHEAPGETHAAAPPPPPAKVVKTKPPKQPGSGVGLAIVATVMIVLVLAAMATYAYIKTAK